MRVSHGSRTDLSSRQPVRGDVDDHLITASDPPCQPHPLRDLASFLGGLKLPFGYGSGGRVHLPPTPAIEVADPLEVWDPSSTKSSRQRKYTRYLIIGISIALWLLAVVLYFTDVNRSWLALEDKWKVSWTLVAKLIVR